MIKMNELNKWETKLKNYRCENRLQKEYIDNYFRAVSTDAKINIAEKAAFIFATTYVYHGELGNIFSFIAFHSNNQKEICQQLNALMIAEPDFTYTKDFHPIMMERSEEYRQLHAKISQ
jgi:hypothetical protein